MKHKFIRITGILGFLLLAAAATAGTWSTNKFFYQPALDARGTTEKNNFDTGLNQADAHLAKYKTLGDPNHTTLAEALTTIGGNNVTLSIPAGTVTVTSNTTIGNNIALRVFNGGKFTVSGGVALTINGPIEAGPYQIFSGSGTVTLGGVSNMYDVWFASPPSNPEGNIAAPVGSHFIKTSGSAPLVYVKQSGTGTTGWVTISGGTSAFTGLADVPSSYGGQAGKALRVNSGASGLEFYTPSSGGSSAFTGLTDVPTSYTGQAGKSVRVNSSASGLEFFALPPSGASVFTGLTDAPGSYTGQAGKAVRVNTLANGLEFYTPFGGAFTGLADAPTSYTGQAGKSVRVNSSANGLEFYTPSSGGASAFTSLTDVPTSYSGQTGKSLRVNSTSTGLEFYTPSSTGGVKPFNILGDTGYTTLSEALTTIGSAATTLVIPTGAGAVAVASNTTIPSNVSLKIMEGGYFSIDNGATLAINSPIEAGPYQIFSCAGTGSVNLQYCPTGEFPLEWWGGLAGLSNNVAAAINQAVVSLRWTDKAIKLSGGQYRLATPVMVNGQGYGLKIRGDGFINSVLVIDVGSGNIGVSVGSDTATWTPTLDLKNFSFGGANTLTFTSVSGSFSQGETVTQATSGATGKVVYYDSANKNIYLQTFSGTFDTSHTVTGGNSGASGIPTSFKVCCLNALKASGVGQARLDVNFWLGSTDYACWLENCDWLSGRIYTRQFLPIGYDHYGDCAKGVYLTNSPASGGNNASELYLDLEAIGSNPSLGIGTSYGANCGGPIAVLNLTGCIENWATGGSPIQIDGADTGHFFSSLFLRFHDLYLEGNPGTIKIANAAKISFDNLLVNAACPITLAYTKEISFSNYWFGGGITVGPDCQSTVFMQGGTTASSSGIVDYAGDTRYVNGPNFGYGWANNQASPQVGQDPTNYIYNMQLNRWQSNVPDGRWVKDGNATWTRCGVGQTDTTQHILPDCAKIVTTTSGDPFNFCSLDAYQLQQLRGKYVTFSLWEYLPLGQTFNNTPFLYLEFHGPAWQGNHAYKLGEAVDDGSGNTYLCVTAGTSGASAPAWNTNDGKTTTDGTVTWRAGCCNVNSNPQYAQVALGQWNRKVASTLCPINATSAILTYAVWRQSGAAAATVYIAEPALMTGRQVQASPVVNNPNENLMPGGLKTTSGTVGAGSPTGWRMQGDIHRYTNPSAGGSPGLVCTASGNPATWKAMPALGN